MESPSVSVFSLLLFSSSAFSISRSRFLFCSSCFTCVPRVFWFVLVRLGFCCPGFLFYRRPFTFKDSAFHRKARFLFSNMPAWLVCGSILCYGQKFSKMFKNTVEVEGEEGKVLMFCQRRLCFLLLRFLLTFCWTCFPDKSEKQNWIQVSLLSCSS